MEFMRMMLILLLVGTNVFAQPYTGSLKCKITGNGFSDETIIAFVPGATSGFDALYDSWKLFSPNPNVPSIYTSIAGGHLSINSNASLEQEWEEILYVRIPDTGFYQLQFSTVYPFDTAVRFSLFDSLNNVVVGNLTSSNYQIHISNMNMLSNNKMKLWCRVHLPTQMDTLIHPTCVDSMAHVTITRPGDDEYSFVIVNASADTVEQQLVLTQQAQIHNLLPGQYRLITQIDGNQQNYISFAVDDEIMTLAEFELSTDTVFLSIDPMVEFWDKSINNIWSLWDFGDGSALEYGDHPFHEFNSTGIFPITMVAGNDLCMDTIIHEVVVLKDMVSGIAKLQDNVNIETYYSNGYLHIDAKRDLNSNYSLDIFQISGQLVSSENGFFAGKQRDFAINLNSQGYLVGVFQTKYDRHVFRFYAN